MVSRSQRCVRDLSVVFHIYIYFPFPVEIDTDFFPEIDGDIAVDIRWSVATCVQHTETRKLQIASRLPPVDGEDESIPVSMRLEPRYDAWLTKFAGIPKHLLLCERMWSRCYELFLPRQVWLKKIINYIKKLDNFQLANVDPTNVMSRLIQTEQTMHQMVVAHKQRCVHTTMNTFKYINYFLFS